MDIYRWGCNYMIEISLLRLFALCQVGHGFLAMAPRVSIPLFRYLCPVFAARLLCQPVRLSNLGP